jgi:hypothetical protein
VTNSSAPPSNRPDKAAVDIDRGRTSAPSQTSWAHNLPRAVREPHIDRAFMETSVCSSEASRRLTPVGLTKNWRSMPVRCSARRQQQNRQGLFHSSRAVSDSVLITTRTDRKFLREPASGVKRTGVKGIAVHGENEMTLSLFEDTKPEFVLEWIAKDYADSRQLELSSWQEELTSERFCYLRTCW